MSGCSTTRDRFTFGRLIAMGAMGFAVALLVDSRAVGSEPASASDGDLNWSKEREFWSFRGPLLRPQPAVRNKRWPRQRLDYFVLARLEQKQLFPSVEANKRALIRRVNFDLTGLPPMPEEVDAFLMDT